MANPDQYELKHKGISERFGADLPSRKKAIESFTAAFVRYLDYPSFTLGEERIPAHTIDDYREHVIGMVMRDSNIPYEVKYELLDEFDTHIKDREVIESDSTPEELAA
jgi:hypothetical protein